jgi:predicted DNA-binding transcriptional regulator AlpA
MTSEIEKAMAETRARELWRFCDLKALGIVEDRTTLRRRMKSDGFPQPIVLSGNSVAWVASEVGKWLRSRPRGAAPQPLHIEAERRRAQAAEAESVA